MQYLKRIRNYELVAFAAGFALMAYELAGSRILSPVVGSSTYVWTSIIGVIVAALSLGYAFGGVVADRRVKSSDVVWLLVASSFTVILTVFLSEPVLNWVATSFGDARVQGLAASLLLFMPTSFLLGMISPYLARLRTESVATTGTSIAGLSALNAIGGILGTFCTGFIFFGYLGSNQSMVLVSLLLVASSWLLAPKHQLMKRAIATVGIIMCGFILSPTSTKVIASIDTPSARYTVADAWYNDGSGYRPVRVLQTGAGSTQSGVYLDGSDELVFKYTRKMAELVDRAPQKRTILVLGGGAFTLPQHLAEKYPGSDIDVVEIDPQLPDISREYFRYTSPSNVRTIAQDARTFVNSNAKQYDVVLVDVYSELSIPFSLSTIEFGAALKRAVAPEGFAAINIIGADSPACSDLLRGLHGSFASHFLAHRAYPVASTDLNRSQNIISVYAHKPLAWLPHEKSTALQRSATYIFTDNFAPVERLKQQCVQSR